MASGGREAWLGVARAENAKMECPGPSCFVPCMFSIVEPLVLPAGVVWVVERDLSEHIVLWGSATVRLAPLPPTIGASLTVTLFMYRRAITGSEWIVRDWRRAR